MSEDRSIPYGPPPPEDQRREARTILPPPPAHVRTLGDLLPEGISDPGELPPPIQLGEPLVLVKPREPQEPAFGKVTRVGFGDAETLHWIAERLAAKYPRAPLAKWYGLVRQYVNLNEVFFRKTERAAILAAAVSDNFLGEYISVSFVLHKDLGPEGGSIQNSQGEREATTLVRELRNWAKLKGAGEIVGLHEFSDLPSSVYVQRFKGERRETVWIPLT